MLLHLRVVYVARVLLAGVLKNVHGCAFRIFFKNFAFVLLASFHAFIAPMTTGRSRSPRRSPYRVEHHVIDLNSDEPVSATASLKCAYCQRPKSYGGSLCPTPMCTVCSQRGLVFIFRLHFALQPSTTNEICDRQEHILCPFCKSSWFRAFEGSSSGSSGDPRAFCRLMDHVGTHRSGGLHNAPDGI